MHSIYKDVTGFIADVTYPDNSIVTAGQAFEKIWEIRNLGGQVWENRKLVCCDNAITVSVDIKGAISPHYNVDYSPSKTKLLFHTHNRMKVFAFQCIFSRHLSSTVPSHFKF
ncbi:NBR1-Ig-like domain-containing protein [Beggiatoa leptomitoformis]|uniref:Uncharacterized protein n=1 Tax=Beggiatoa leptomitoformis TaxID=288004 RepID=A0A2N9YCN3_9GAMM|nr:NBR1-Ig-like domain-containing protein [Beggiatoa leptomitoformis]ALG66471.1 hypothetical protein AL038_00370 [Beggiatoa leptomitoformis]AUI68239.1 hypothetical protein BLE401_05675 [Beggiatoa leptomitoformis]